MTQFRSVKLLTRQEDRNPFVKEHVKAMLRKLASRSEQPLSQPSFRNGYSPPDRQRKVTSAVPPQGEPAIDRAVQERFGALLRSMYDERKAEPIPDRLLDLLKQLDKRGSGRGR
jgi:Anti-sigma factor NepR